MTAEINVKNIIDFAIGDGHLRTNHKNYYYSESHAAKQAEYLKHKAAVFANTGYAVKVHEYQYKNKPYIRMWTGVHTDFTTAYKYLYNKGRKAIDKNLIRQFDARTLAYWFMDDGSFDSRKKDLRFTHRYELYLTAMLETEVNDIQTWLFDMFNIETKKYFHSGDGYALFITDIQNKNRFRDTILPYYHDSMKYKIELPHSITDARLLYHGERPNEQT